MAFSEKIVRTSQADIGLVTTSGDGPAIVLIHGNSGSHQVFKQLLEGEIGREHRVIALDLPGHGDSSNAFAPEETYSMTGYAAAVSEALEILGVERATIFGWSLGGHVGIELLTRFPGINGLLISGTPPVRPTAESIGEGFLPEPLLQLFFKEIYKPSDFDAFMASVYGDVAKPEYRAALRRTDGRARRMLFENVFAGRSSDQRELVEKATVPIAIIDGAKDPFVNLDYISSLSIPSLWERHAYVFRNVGHAAFLSEPQRFGQLLGRFVQHAGKKAARRPITKRRDVAAA